MERIYRATLLVVYQLTLLAGIALMPVAMATRRMGVRIPAHRPVERLRRAYRRAES